MERFRRLFAFFLPLLLLTVLTGQAGAALLDFGPIVPEVNPSTEGTFGKGDPPYGHGYPRWYRDTNRVPLELCTNRTSGMCLTAEPNPAAPLTFPSNMGDEHFWWVGDATFVIPQQGALARAGSAILVQALEAAFSTGGVVSGAQVSFARIRIRVDTPYAGNYVVTTPFKQFNFTVTDTAAGINFTEDIGIAQGDFSGALSGSVGPFLYCINAPIVVPGEGSFLGNPAVPCQVLGSTFPSAQNPTNYFRVQGPSGFDMQTNQFAISGKIFEGDIPTPLKVDKVTYARNAAATEMQVNVFATTQPLANPKNTAAAFPANFFLSGVLSDLQISGIGIPTRPLITNIAADGKFFSASGIFPDTGAPPATVTVTNLSDIPQTAVTAPLVDEVVITRASYNPVNSTLSIAASSSDRVATPALQAFIPGMTVPIGTLSNGLLNVSFPFTDNSVPQQPKTYNIPPSSVQVVSLIGGSATASVSVVVPPPPPVAVNDNAATAMNSATAIIVLANDTADGGINPATVAVITPPASGATAVANANGTVTYTPTAAFSGSETFTYTFSDFFSQTSNMATVTVTVHAPPVAGNDTASTAVNSLVNINVIGNDTASDSSINSASLSIVSPATCGTTAIQSNGTVNFTAPATQGTCSFSYVVSDTFVPVATSNVATVTVTVTPPPVPAPATGVAVTSTLASPEAAQGTQITFIASGSGGSGSYEYSYWLFNGTSWSEIRPYSTASSWTWDTTGLATGVTYVIAVNVRSVGSSTPFEAVAYSSVKLNPTTINLVVTANTPSPQLPGTSVTFSAAASGSSGNYSYQFYLFNGTSWTLVQDFSSVPTWTWDSTGLPAGDYQVGVNVLNSSLVGTVANGYFSYTLTTPVTSVNVISDQPSPHTAGTPVTFAASGVGGSGTYEYEFSFFNGVTWSLVKPYSGTGTWTLPGATVPGDYVIGVNARNAGASNPTDVVVFVPFIVQ